MNEQLQTNSKVELEFRKKSNAEEMKHQVITFSLMILLTIGAFLAVSYDGFSLYVIGPILVTLAIVQVIFQLFYFMHMSHKGHAAPQLFMFSGIFFAGVMALAFSTIIWW